MIEKASKPHIQVETSQGEKTFSSEEISSMVLIKMKEVAEAYLGKKVTHAVVTVPAVSKKLNDQVALSNTNGGVQISVFYCKIYLVI